MRAPGFNLQDDVLILISHVLDSVDSKRYGSFLSVNKCKRINSEVVFFLSDLLRNKVNQIEYLYLVVAYSKANFGSEGTVRYSTHQITNY